MIDHKIAIVNDYVNSLSDEIKKMAQVNGISESEVKSELMRFYYRNLRYETNHLRCEINKILY